MREQNELEISKAKEMAAIDTHKFKDQVDAIGPETIAAIANAGPAMQVSPTVSSDPAWMQLVCPLPSRFPG